MYFTTTTDMNMSCSCPTCYYYMPDQYDIKSDSIILQNINNEEDYCYQQQEQVTNTFNTCLSFTNIDPQQQSNELWTIQETISYFPSSPSTSSDSWPLTVIEEEQQVTDESSFYFTTNTTTTDTLLDRPFSCSFCHRSFTRKHDLQRHVRVHTGDKPYCCPCCLKAFSRTDALKRHLRMEDVCRYSHEVQAMKAMGKRRFRNL